MTSSDRILTLDIGSSKLLLAEFAKKSDEVVLLKYAIGPLRQTDSPEEATTILRDTLKSLVADNGFDTAPMMVALPGQTVFPRYVKLPPVSMDKVAEMVSYEAEQNVPFPISEVVWDYQILESEDGGEINALLVAVKRENVEEATAAVVGAGLDIDGVDASPMALYNAVRFNYPNLTGCTMVLDIGARSTNLIFIEGDRIFTRSIPVAGNSITQEIAKGFGISAPEAESLKHQSGFVALGGVYQMTEDERADKMSKMIRNVVTRLHAEVSRSINFYRSQQGGSPPVRALLTGGTAMMPYLDTFFREKLQIDVEFFNPFVNVSVDSSVEGSDAESSGRLMQLGCAVGLALRASMKCPVEIDLTPHGMAAKKAMRKRIPFFIASAAGVVLAMLSMYAYANQISKGYKEQHSDVAARLKNIQNIKSKLDSLRQEQADNEAKAVLLEAMANNRSAYARIFESIRNGLQPGMWITGIHPSKSSAEVIGSNIILVEGMAYDDDLVKRVGDGTAAVSKYLSDLLKAPGSPFIKGSVKQTAIIPDASKAFRKYVLELILRDPLGIPTALPNTTAETVEDGAVNK